MAAGIPKPPSHLSAAARRAWASIATVVDDMGVLTEADAFALEMLCNAYVDLVQARASLARPLVCALSVSEEGDALAAPDAVFAAGGERYYWTIGKSGPMRRTRPEVADIADAERRLAMWFSKFGLSPADRSRVSATKKVDSNPFAELG